MKNTILRIISISIIIANSGYMLASDHPRIKALMTASQERLQQESIQHQSYLNTLFARCTDQENHDDLARQAINSSFGYAALTQKRREAQRAEAEANASAARAALLLRKRKAIAQEDRINRQLALHNQGMAPAIPEINSHELIPAAPAMQIAPAGTAADSKVAFEHLSRPREEELPATRTRPAGLAPKQHNQYIGRPTAFAKDLAKKIGIHPNIAKWIEKNGVSKQAIENSHNKGTPFENCTPINVFICIPSIKTCTSKTHLFAGTISLSNHHKNKHHGETFCPKCLKGFPSVKAFLADHLPA